MPTGLGRAVPMTGLPCDDRGWRIAENCGATARICMGSLSGAAPKLPSWGEPAVSAANEGCIYVTPNTKTY